MHYGYTPPFTGSMESNPHWYQIDPQLINEIWSYTAPGMVRYAAGKSAWAARITSDGWAISPTIHYGAMYAEAFFESNIEKLVLDALKYLPADDRYAATVRHMYELYKKYPNDWQKARARWPRLLRAGARDDADHLERQSQRRVRHPDAALWQG